MSCDTNQKIQLGQLPKTQGTFSASLGTSEAVTEYALFSLSENNNSVPDTEGTNNAKMIKVPYMNIIKAEEGQSVKIWIEEEQADGSMLRITEKISLDMYNTMCADQASKITINGNIVIQKSQVLIMEVGATATESPVSVSGNYTVQY